jgi:hypothetical protein
MVSSSTSGAMYRRVPTRLLGAMSIESVTASCLTARPEKKNKKKQMTFLHAGDNEA